MSPMNPLQTWSIQILSQREPLSESVVALKCFAFIFLFSLNFRWDGVFYPLGFMMANAIYHHLYLCFLHFFSLTNHTHAKQSAVVKMCPRYSYELLWPTWQSNNFALSTEYSPWKQLKGTSEAFSHTISMQGKPFHTFLYSLVKIWRMVVGSMQKC